MLNGHLATLNRFISRFTDKCKPFFQALKKKAADFCWNEECEVGFQELKRYFISPPVETCPGRDVVPLPCCLGVNSERSLDLREEGAQKPVYYVSHTMNDLQTRY